MDSQKILRVVGIVITVIIFAASGIFWGLNLLNGKKAEEPSTKTPVTSTKQMPVAGTNAVVFEALPKNGQPSFVMFHAPWCSYCEKFKPTFKELSDEYKGKVNFVMIDGEDPKNLEMVKEFRIGMYPTIYIIDPVLDNRVSISSTYYGEKAMVKQEIDRYLRVRSMIPVSALKK